MAVAFLSMSILRNSVPLSDVSSTTPFPLILKISPSHFLQGPKFSPRPSVQPLFTICCNILLCSDPLLYHRSETNGRGRPHDRPSDPGHRGGSMPSQMEAKLAGMNLKSPGLKSPISDASPLAHLTPAPIRTAKSRL